MDELSWLFQRQRFGMKSGLARISALLECLGRPQDQFVSILVGGTNGKGSSSSTLASIISASGKKTALFTSPHLTYFAERFVIDAKPLETDLIIGALTAVQPHAEALEATFFEITTALACLLFATAKVDIAVMEVGLGGRFDATNSLEPVLSLITNIDLDHTDILGSSVEQIAFEKAGIMRKHRPVLSAAKAKAAQVLAEQARLKGAELWLLGKEIDVQLKRHSWQGLDLEVSSPLAKSRVQSPLLGRFQAANISLAVTAAHLLGVEATAIRSGVAKTFWPGRLERIRYQNKTFLLDGAHNPAAARVLRETLDDFKLKDITLIFGANKDKDLAETLLPLATLAKHVIVTKASLIPKASSPESLRKLWPGAIVAKTPEQAIQRALELTTEQVIVVAGSLYLAGEVRPIILGQSGEGFERHQ